ncbi:MAG TPA: metallophosphoesterase [Polyangia bacterium]|jgi:predicted phosphodiesterase
MKFLPARLARCGSIVLGVLAVASASCSTNESGRLSADRTGDVSAAPVTRVALSGAPPVCAGLPAEGAGGTALARAPYLQRTTAHDAVVVWTSVAEGSASVLVESPDGTQQTTFPAAIDPSVPREAPDYWTRAASGGGVTRQWMATVSGLTPDTTYCYTIYQDGQPVTAPAPLRSAPAPGSTGRVQFVALGDSGGGGSDQRALLRQIETVPFDFMIHTGDIAYDDGTLAEFESRFFGVYAPLLASRPIFPASGNHDYETADAAPYRQVFVLPENGGPDGVERWYSYDWGDVHLVALDTEKIGPSQAAWLEADLAANQLPWTIVYGHRPPHSSGEHGDDPGFNSWLVPILKAHHVQLVLSGHDHDYERFQPIDGITYIVTGGGGKGVRDFSSLEQGSAFADAVIHVLVVTVDADTLTTHAIDGTGREFDSTTINR